MHLALTIFAVLAILLLIQSAASLQSGLRFLRLVRRALGRVPGEFVPPATVIVPVKGVDPELERSLRSILHQDYPFYEVIFVAAEESDAGWPLLQVLASGRTEKPAGRGLTKVSLLAAGRSEECGEKVHNLRSALGSVDPRSEVLVFADSDAEPKPDWLRWLIGPLEDPSVTVSTGFRWYLPGNSFASRLRAAWDTSIATMLGEHDHNFAWGGSMALRKADFERLGIRDKYWASTVSDDYAVWRAVREAKGRIRFQPRCLVASREELSAAGFIRWANRQIILTRVYAPSFWWPGLAAHALYGATFLAGALVLASPAATAVLRLGTAGIVCLIVALGMAKGRIRTIVARELFQEERELLAHQGNCYWLLAPLVPWVMLWNFVVSAFSRRVEWRGVRYTLHPGGRVGVLRGPKGAGR
jgi:ceramide glucosyltransferase